MKSSGPFLLLLLFLLSLSHTVSGLGSVVWKGYSYQPNHYTWQDAQSYCRNSTSFPDLATIFTESDEQSINVWEYYAWTGIHKPIYHYNYNYWVSSNGVYSNLQPYWTYQSGDAYCAVAAYSNKWLNGTDCDKSYFFFCQHNNDKDYTFIPLSKIWSEAQQYCKSYWSDGHHDLATFHTYFDLYSTLIQQDFPVWTGLHRDEGTWRWSTGLSKYRNWASNEPGNDDCVSISSRSKKMATQSCSARFPFLCFADNLVLVKENKTWEKALEHCRALHSISQPNLRYELVSVQPGKDHDYVMNRVMEANTEEVWAGLRFLAGEWLWVNGASMLYSNLPRCPTLVQHCGALSKNNTGSVETKDCSEKRNFLCYSTS
ncbi:uncharacterized protein LOC116067180 [Sander lucioperca]|uniref:uncharacterized protein LOC116067180 n=1 Tax=Sander lucioperca TaxID=283035 RepID=UPI00165393C8|nr:uncharacterized protein LOC116067180 [Sander lucioperca]